MMSDFALSQEGKGGFRFPSVAAVLLLFLGTCTPQGKAPDVHGDPDWRLPDPDSLDCPPLAKPQMRILKILNEEVFGRHNGDPFFQMTYSHRGHDAKYEQHIRDELRKLWPVRIEWRQFDLFPSGEFARIEARIIDLRDQSLFRGESWYLFRKHTDGWKLAQTFPTQIGEHKFRWCEVLLLEADNALRRQEGGSRRTGPDWATDGEVIRILKLALELCRKEQQFPIESFIRHLTSHNPLARQFAYDALVQAFRVDFGYAEPKEGQTGELSSKSWVMPWYQWLERTYPRREESGYERFAPWP